MGLTPRYMSIGLCPQSHTEALEPNLKHAYSEASPIIVNGAYSQVSVDWLQSLLWFSHC